MSITIWHNPRCSSSRKALELLQQNGCDPVIRLYLTDPPSVAEINDIQQKLNQPVSSFTRSNEAIFTELGLAETSENTTLAAAISAHPILLQRPIVVSKTKAAIGRPPETVLAIL